MADRPILFSAPMVQALLGGRKTQTRRILDAWTEEPPAYIACGAVVAEDPDGAVYRWPRTAAVGDRLWVRETVACGVCAPSPPSRWAPFFWRREQGTPANPNGLWYRADGLEPEKTITDRGRWVPGIHMPRWASRLTLHVEDVKVERLQDISEEDAAAEGVELARFGWLNYLTPSAEYALTARDSFASLWISINGRDAWEKNPWIIAINFEVERVNVDAATSTLDGGT